jgi:hypothetical protein
VTYKELWARYEDGGEPARARILAYIDDLTAKNPDLDDLKSSATTTTQTAGTDHSLRRRRHTTRAVGGLAFHSRQGHELEGLDLGAGQVAVR